MIVRMAAKGLLTIPSAIRRKLGMMARVRVHLDVDEQARRIVLTPITCEYILSYRGKYKGKGLLKSLSTEKKRGEDL
jgi:bifunctional DNA-binding transcriptional regulator/antitoxin component of YhaV-PrlF toxin-antitoxin module